MQPLFRSLVGNPSSQHQEGQRARRALQQARRDVARSLGSMKHQVVFTGNGSEANLLALAGACAELPRGRRHVLTTPIEHPSVLQPLRELMQRGEIELEFLDVDDQGRVHPDQILTRIRPSTGLVSVMLANNEIGTLQPIKEISEKLVDHPTLVHTDATQGIGRVPIDRGEIGADLVTLSAHKFGGPRGVGILVLAPGVSLATPLSLGRQEQGLRGGTEDVVSCVGAAAALRVAVARCERIAPVLEGMTRRLRSTLAEDPRVVFHSPASGGLPGLLNFSIENHPGAHMIAALDQQGVAISHGSACSSFAALPSHVLMAIGAEEHASSALRVSFGYTSVESDVDEFVQRLRVVVETARKSSESQNGPKR